jgi:hypothetical protein
MIVTNEFQRTQAVYEGLLYWNLPEENEEEQNYRT